MQKRQLGSLAELGEGGYGKVYRVGARLPGVPFPLAYKDVLPDHSERDEALRAMERAVDIRDRLSEADRAELDRLTTWPIAVVDHHATMVGALMPLLAPDFFTVTNRDGVPGKTVFELQFLCGSDEAAHENGLDRSAVDDDLVRLSLAAQLAYTIALLHRNNIVYGDLNLRNVVIAGNPPRAILVDCDPAAALSDLARHQGHVTGFTPPEIQNGSQALQDLETDIYKLGLCVIRALAKGPGATQLMDPGKVAQALGAHGVELLRLALSADRSLRPSAEKISIYLTHRVLALAQPPDLQWAALNRQVLLRGSDVLVTWSHRYATKLRIFGVNGFEVKDVDPDAHPNGFAIRPPTAGPIFVEASNRHGTDMRQAGYVDYYEPPPFDIKTQVQGLLPRLMIPDLPSVQMPHVLARLPYRPMVFSEGHPPPHVELPAIAPYLPAMRPEGTVPDASDTSSVLARAYVEANEQMGVTLSSGLETLLTAMNERVKARSAILAQGPDASKLAQPDDRQYPHVKEPTP